MKSLLLVLCLICSLQNGSYSKTKHLLIKTKGQTTKGYSSLPKGMDYSAVGNQNGKDLAEARASYKRFMKNIMLKQKNRITDDGLTIQGGSFGADDLMNRFGIPPKCKMNDGCYIVPVCKFCAKFWNAASRTMEQEDEDGYEDAYENQGLENAYDGL